MKEKKKGNSKQKLIFKITSYSAFQNVNNILQKLKLLLVVDRDHKKVFPDAHAAGSDCALNIA